MPPLGDAAGGKRRVSAEQSAWKAGRISLEGARRGRSPSPRRAGAEGWVFAGEMRVLIQLAYKVPVLGPQDRRLLFSPPRLSPPGGRELGSQVGQGPRPGRTSRIRSGGGLARRARLGLCAEVRGIPVLGGSNWNGLGNSSWSLRAVRVLRVELDPRRGRPGGRAKRAPLSLTRGAPLARAATP